MSRFSPERGGTRGARAVRLWLCAAAGAVAFAPAFAVTPAAEPPAAEREAIERVVTEAYVDGVHNFRDPAAMRNGFHPDFEMLVLRDGKLEKVPLAKWIEGMEARNLKEPPPKASPEAVRETTATFAAVDITGSAATCKVEIRRAGKQLFTDYLSLYRFDDGWKIVGKSFYRHP